MPKTAAIVYGLAISAVLFLFASLYNHLSQSYYESKEKAARIERYDIQKRQELKRAQDAQDWADGCRAANVLGQDSEAVSCDMIQVDSIITDESALAFEGTKDPDVVKVHSAAYLNWNANARGEAQAPVYLSTDTTLENRAKEMLRAFEFDSRYKLTPGYGYELFKKVGDRHGIKPEVLICIAKADTLLGQATKSSFNLGNVGNNDRGNTVHFKDVGAGIDAIGKVLNNKYLSHKMSLGSLTPYSGGNPPFYATSPTGNWYNNVRNCLAEILDDATVGPDFMIRNK